VGMGVDDSWGGADGSWAFSYYAAMVAVRGLFVRRAGLALLRLLRRDTLLPT
jgi:hypothetical protein